MEESAFNTLAEAELARLARALARHDALYYQGDAPEISDADYDALRRRHADIEARFPELVKPDSPSQRVGAGISEAFAEVRHGVPMLSLDNAFTDEEVEEFVGRVRRYLKLPDDEPVILTAEPKAGGMQLRNECTIEIEGESKPACVAETISVLYGA